MHDEYGNYIGEEYSDDETSVSISYASSAMANSVAKIRRKEIAEAKRLDPGYNKLYRTTTKISGGEPVQKRVAIELYTCSDTPGRMIRSAIGGAFHSNYRVGKTDEYIFFKVGMATGECRGDTNTMYFDTPEQYEKTLNVKVSQDIKDNWYARFNYERKYREELAAMEVSRSTVIVK
uniref:Uncharacterized protein n=1 Tax=viral metagenome TaxID=1070528 RepID=A0A6C0HI50_9ZZZZ